MWKCSMKKSIGICCKIAKKKLKLAKKIAEKLHVVQRNTNSTFIKQQKEEA